MVWINQYMHMDSEIKICKAHIRSIMIYDIETREDTVKTKNMLHVAEIKTLRIILRKIGRNRKRIVFENDVIRKQCNIQDIVRDGAS